MPFANRFNDLLKYLEHHVADAPLSYTVLRDGIFTHPTAAEGLVYLLAEVPAKAMQQPA